MPYKLNEVHDLDSLLTVRVVGKTGEILGSGRLTTLTDFSFQPCGHRIWHCSVRFDPPLRAPMWHSPEYLHKWYSIDFTLPSGWQNIWGQGNNFDVDDIQIHPDDLEVVRSTTAFVYLPLKLSTWGKIKNFFKKAFTSG